MKKFLLIHGYLEINNSVINIKYTKGKYFLDLLKFFGSIGLITTFIKKLKSYNSSDETYDFYLLLFFGLGSLCIVYFFFEILFKKIWLNKIELTDLVRIEIENNENQDEEIDEDSKVNITFVNSKNRNKEIELKKENNQLQSFIEIIKLRNSKIIIKNIEE